MEQQIAPRLPGHFGGHLIVIRLAALEAVDVSVQRLLASRGWHSTHRNRSVRLVALLAGTHQEEACALSGPDDLQARPRGARDGPRTDDVAQDRARSVGADPATGPALPARLHADQRDV